MGRKSGSDGESHSRRSRVELSRESLNDDNFNVHELVERLAVRSRAMHACRIGTGLHHATLNQTILHHAATHHAAPQHAAHTTPHEILTIHVQVAASKEERRKKADTSDATAANLSRLRSMRVQFERAIDQLQAIR